jgi:V-type H+-transporting ATPase subunit E
MENAVKVAEKIFKSRKVNECRMSEMKVRFDMIERIQEETKNHLKTKTQNQQEYRQLLKGLITQGLIKLLEEKVEIRCLRSDERLISEVMSECQRDFNGMCDVQT